MTTGNSPLNNPSDNSSFEFIVTPVPPSCEGSSVPLNNVEDKVNDFVKKIINDSNSEPTTDPKPIEGVRVEVTDTSIGGNVPPMGSGAPVDEAAKLNRINDLAKEPPKEERSSQLILTEMKAALERLGYTNIKIGAELEKDQKDSFKVESYKSTSDPSKTFYRAKVEYCITAIDTSGKPYKSQLLERTISTTAENPEDAIIVASQFKKTVCELAEGSGNYPDSFKNCSVFNFKFAKNELGLSHLEAIKIRKESGAGTAQNNEFIEHKCSHPSVERKYRYNFKSSKGPQSERPEEKREEYSDSRLGSVSFDTEEQMLLSRHGYVIAHNFKDLMESGGLEVTASRLKEEIKKKSGEFAQVQADFIKSPRFQFIGNSLSWLFGSKPNVELAKSFELIKEQDKAFAEIEEKNLAPSGPVTPSSQTPKIHKYAELLKEISELKSKSAGQDDSSKSELDKKNKELNDLKEEIIQEHQSYSKKLFRLVKLQRDLKSSLDQLSELQKTAEKMNSSQTTADSDKKILTSFLKSTSKKSMGQLNAESSKRQEVVNAILELSTESIPDLNEADLKGAEISAEEVAEQPSAKKTASSDGGPLFFKFFPGADTSVPSDSESDAESDKASSNDSDNEINYQNYIAKATCGDGACALHALLGEEIDGMYTFSMGGNKSGDPGFLAKSAFTTKLKEKIQEEKKEEEEKSGSVPTPFIDSFIEAMTSSIESSRSDLFSNMLFNNEKGRALKKQWDDLEISFSDANQNLKNQRAKYWSQLLSSDPIKSSISEKIMEIVKTKKSTSSFYGKEIQEVLDIIGADNNRVLDLIDEDKNAFLELLSNSQRVEITKIEIPFDKNKAGIKKRRKELLLSNDSIDNYTTVLLGSDYYLSLQEIKLAALLFNKKVQVVRVVDSQYQPAEELMNPDADGDLIVIKHQDAHFERCVKAK